MIDDKMTPASTDLTRALFSARTKSIFGARQFERINTTRRTRSVASVIVATLDQGVLSRNATLLIERLCQEFCRARSSLDRGRTPCKRHRMDTLHAPGARTPFGHGAGGRVWQGRRRGRESGRRRSQAGTRFACEGSRTRDFFRSTSGAEERGSKLGRLGLKLKTRTSL